MLIAVTRFNVAGPAGTLRRTLGSLAALLIALLIAGCGSTGDSKEDKDFQIADTNLRLGVGYMRQGRYEDALEKLQKAEAAKPDYADVHSALAMVYERLLEYKKADHHYAEAIDLKPDEGSHHNNYGVFLCRRGEFKKADKYFQNAINSPRYKTPELALENAGACAKQIPDLEKAEDYLRRALSINPKRSLALAEMADVMYQKQNYMSTRAYLQRLGDVSNFSPQSLWLGIQTERKLGDGQAEARYAKLLQSRYPDSAEFKRWLDETP